MACRPLGREHDALHSSTSRIPAVQYTLILHASKAMPKQCVDFLSGKSKPRRTVGVRMPGDAICQVSRLHFKTSTCHMTTHVLHATAGSYERYPMAHIVAKLQELIVYASASCLLLTEKAMLLVHGRAAAHQSRGEMLMLPCSCCAQAVLQALERPLLATSVHVEAEEGAAEIPEAALMLDQFAGRGLDFVVDCGTRVRPLFLCLFLVRLVFCDCFLLLTTCVKGTWRKPQKK